MVEIITSLPGGLVPPFAANEATDLPVVRVEGREIVIPVLVRRETRYEYTEGEEESAREIEVYVYFEVRTKYLGGDVNDYEAICRTHYAGLREAFYGTAEYQADLEYDHKKTGHILAVKNTFRKPGQTTPPDGLARWNEIKEMFKSIIRDALAIIDKTAADLPPYFNAEDLLILARENGMTEEQIAGFAARLQVVSLDMLHNGRNWSELFN